MIPSEIHDLIDTGALFVSNHIGGVRGLAHNTAHSGRRSVCCELLVTEEQK